PRRVSDSRYRIGDLYWDVPIPGTLNRSGRMDPRVYRRRDAKSGLPFSQPGGDSSPVSLALVGRRDLGGRRLVGQSFTFSRLAHPLAAAGIRGRMACCFRRNGTTNHQSNFSRRTIASSAGQGWADPLAQTFKTFVD